MYDVFLDHRAVCALFELDKQHQPGVGINVRLPSAFLLLFWAPFRCQYFDAFCFFQTFCDAEIG